MSISAVNKDVAWAAGSETDGCRPMLRRTLDGGSTWEKLNPSNIRNWVSSIAAIDSNTAWAGAPNGPDIFKTIDGGITWTSRGKIAADHLSATSEDVVWAVGDSSIYRTVDSGAHWEVARAIPGEHYTNVYALKSGTASVVGYTATGENQFYGFILMTTDGGDTWDKYSPESLPQLFGIYAPNANIAWVAGGEGGHAHTGIILRTLDGGGRWIVILGGTLGQLKSIFAVGQDAAWAVGYAADGNQDMRNAILGTHDGGFTWIIQSIFPGFQGYLNDIHGVDAEVIWAVGSKGLILRTENGGWTR